MPDLDDVAGRLAAAQTRRERARLDLLRTTEHQQRLTAATQRLDRHFDADNAADLARRAELDRRMREAAVQTDLAAATLAEQTGVLDDLTVEFLPFTDPREHLPAKGTDVPVLMFPLRLETRFKTVAGPDDDPAEQLWVRVYPDDCLVDTFEDLPAEGELLATEKFWVDRVAAGGDPGQRRGAWRGLVSTSGAGRAAWLIQQYGPDPADVFPTKTDPAGLVLVVTARPPVPGPEKLPVAAYWTRVWTAAGDATEQAAAYADLEAAIGVDRAAAVRSAAAPRNLSTTPPAGRTRADVEVAVAFLELPDPSSVAVQRQPWSQAPRVRVLPERLVLVGYRDGAKVLEVLGNPIPSPLVAGPDPLAAQDDQLRRDGADIAVGDPMKWMVDFDEAVRIGMGFRVGLSATDRQAGFDELTVIGVRLGADTATGKALVEELFTHHQNGTAGFGLLPQGTPTNNTEQGGSGFSATEDADDTFDLVFGNLTPLARRNAWLPRPDGQWLADMLGLDLSTFDKTPHARGRDQCEARAMNIALWPATWGYYLESMIGPALDAETVEQTRWFFTNFVVARGTVPAVRIGDQPYGILPATAFSRMSWFAGKGFAEPAVPAPPAGTQPFLAGLQRLLATVRADWTRLEPAVGFVGKPTDDPHQLLLDVLGHHGGSVELYQRYAETLEHLTNGMAIAGFWSELLTGLVALDPSGEAMSLLRRLGYPGEEVPELLEKYFLDEANKLAGDLVDDRPLSQTSPVRPYTDDGRNYLRWLVDTARTSFDTLRRQDGFTDGTPPSALLYLMLHHALQLSYWDVSLRLYQRADVLSADQLTLARLDPSFVHVAEPGPTTVDAEPVSRFPTSGKPVRMPQRSESRYEYLYRAEPAVTGSDDLLVAEFIPHAIGTATETRHLDQQLRAVEQLVDTPTAALERLLTEHIDLCSYRLDAWRAGLVGHRLAGLRYGARDTVRTGVHLGAFGWLTDVRSEDKQLSPVELSDELDTEFNPPGHPDLPPLMRDDSNGGFIHAPSLNHATAAAILRNGYLANATPDNPETLKVNLSSERVRQALGVIDGIRGGQTLGALLGYQLERGLHDRHDEAEVDMFILDLRKAFPLVADKITDTASEEDDTIDAVEARNVVDGYALINHIKATGESTYPFGKQLQPATPAQAAVIDTEVDRIRDIHDALADLAMSEGVHQTVLGNTGRIASTLDAYSRGTFPPEPEVVTTPRSGIGLTHRIGLHLPAGLDPASSPNTMDVTPRAHAEPAVNAWLDGVLPAPADVFCTAGYLDPADGTVKTVDVTQEELGLQPIDLVYLLNPTADQAMSAVDDLVVRHVLTTYRPRWDAGVTISYLRREPGRFSFFEVGALVRPLRALLLKSRPLTAADVALPNEATTGDTETVVADAGRLTAPLDELAAVVTDPGAADDLATLTADMAPLLADPGAHRTAILAAIDSWIDRAMGLFAAASRFAVPDSGTGFAHDWKQRQFARLRELALALTAGWQSRLDEVRDLLEVQLPLATTDEDRLVLLRRAEALVSASATAPPPPPAGYLTIVESKRDTFAGKHTDLVAITTSPVTDLSALLASIATEQPLTDFDSRGLDVTPVEDEVVRFAGDLLRRVTLLGTGIEQRTARTQELITAAAAAGTPSAAVQALTDAAKALLGDDFRIVPEFQASTAQAGEWNKAWTARTELLSYLTDAAPAGLGIDHPVDEWLYGVARVRDTARDWERMTMLANAFRTADPELTPIQLPYRAGDRWLGLPHPPGYPFDGHRLLYTAHYAVPFDAPARQCALLLDEWTEVIPREEETTGITFHYDQPSTEPPQVMLLVTSPRPDGPWRWDDLVDAVRETFAEARLRAVEPTQLDGTGWARLLPATLSSTTRYPITIGLDLALNNLATTIGTTDG